MSCTVQRVGLISKDILKEIVSSHENDFIKDLDYSKQRQVTTVIAEGLYKASLTEGIISSKDVVSDIVKDIKANLITLNDSKATLESVNFDNSMDTDIAVLTEAIEDNQNVIKNMDKLVYIATNLLRTYNGLKIKKLSTLNEEKQDTDQENEAGLERTSFSDNYSLELDSKDTTSARLKKFLAFVSDHRFDQEGNVIKKESFIGTDIPLNFDYIYRELHRILEGVESNEEAVLNKLELFLNDDVIPNRNNNLAWLKGFVPFFKASPSHIKREFVSDMAKHKTDMEFVVYDVKKDRETQEESTSVRVYSDNSASTTRRIHSSWQKAHSDSSVLENGKYSAEKKQELLEQLSTLRNYKTDKEKIDGLTSLFSKLGVTPNPIYLESLFKTNKLYYGVGKSVTGIKFIESKGLLEHKLNTLPVGATTDDVKYLNDNIFQGLAAGSAKFSKDEFSDSFRVGDKTIFTYTNNHYLSNRFRALLAPGAELINKLKNTLFVKDSLYLNLLRDSNSNFKNWFKLSYISLNPLKNNVSKKRSEGASKMSPLDMEVVKVGMFNANKYYSPLELNGNTYQQRKAKYFFPTNSDKSRIMMSTGVAIDATTNYTHINKTTTSVRTKFYAPSIDLFYNSVVKPEVDRIYHTSQPGFKEKANLATYNGGLFYLFPELNEVKLKYPSGERLLLDVIKSGEVNKQVEDILKQFVERSLSRIAKAKLQHWKELGIIETNEEGDTSYNYVERITNKQGNLKSIEETAMDFVFNYALHNANMYQLIIGDPAQYYKRNIEGTYDNLFKRLAAEIAPGIEMEGPDYIQLYIKDRVSISTKFEYILKTLDGLTIQEYNKLTKKQVRKLKSFPYTEIEGTDAQEYTTWREHLNILKYLGRVTNKEYKAASDAFSQGKVPSKKIFDKVLQPMKPVYVNNTIVEVGEMFLDKKTYIKSSSFPLIPFMTQGLEIDKLRIEMEKIEKSTGRGVRAAFKTATKVGFPSNALSIFDEAGNITIDTTGLDFNEFITDRKGLRIQQDIPYDPNKSTFNKGSQESKLIWANILEVSFDYNGKKYTGEELRTEFVTTFKKLYNHGLKKLRNRITNPDGAVNMEMISNLLKEELLKRGETNKAIIDGLDVEYRDYNENGKSVKRKNFKVDLWLSPYADKYMAMLSSLVKNNVVSHKLTGKSFVLGSNEGFKGIITEPEARNPVASIPMNFKDGTGGRIMRPEFKGKSTMDLILSGDRIATSRDYSKYYNKQKLNKGDIVRFYSNEGKEVLVRVTKEPYSISKVSASEWSKLEGWAEKGYHRLNGNYQQFQFELISDKTFKDTGIVTTDSYDPETGLKPQYTDDDGVVHPAQVMIPFKFRDSKGNLLDLTKFVKDGKIDHSKLPKELLKSFGFRIPTQLHSNMSFMEIVGFLPESQGDLIIAPREFTKQMGSDFDVDKLYSYLYHTSYNSETGTIYKTTQDITNEDLESLNLEHKQLIKRLFEEVEEPANVLSLINSEVAAIEDDTISNKAVTTAIISQLDLENDQLVRDLITNKITQISTEKSYIGGLHNKLLDIRLTVVKSKEVQSSILNPLGFGQYLDEEISYTKEGTEESKVYKGYADLLNNLNSQHETKLKSILDESYQTDKFYDGTAGKDGISMFSSDSVFNALSQNKDLIVTTTIVDEEGKAQRIPITVEFGNKYHVSNGNISGIRSLKKKDPRLKTEVIAAAQNLSVDNANEQGMYKVNMNTHTFGPYSILNFLGFEEELSATFMSQPIIVDYVKKMRLSKSILKPYLPNIESDIVEELTAKYSEGTQLDESLADFKGKDAVQELLKMIEKREGYKDFGKYQTAILAKFITLKNYEKTIAPLKQLLNVDSKGFHKSMYVNQDRVTMMEELSSEDSTVLNAHKLIGEYSPEVNLGFTTSMNIEPTTLAGLDNVLGTKEYIRLFKNYFLESNSRLNFDKALNSINSITNLSGSSPTQSLIKEVKESYKDYLTSNIRETDVNELRKQLFNSKETGSLYDSINKLKETGYWNNSVFLKSLDINMVNDNLIIDYNNAGADNFDETNQYLSFIDLFRQGTAINEVVPSILGEDLVKYAILRGDLKAKQFLKLVPSDIFKSIVSVPNEVHETKFFVDQFMRHNPDKAQRVKDYTSKSNGVQIRPTNPGFMPTAYISVKENWKLKLYRSIGSGNYQIINRLGSDNFNEYSIYSSGMSILKDNNSVETSLPKNETPIVSSSTLWAQTDGVQVTTETAFTEKSSTTKNDFNLASADLLLESIIENKNLPEFSELAIAIKNSLPKGLELQVVEGKKMSYNNSRKTITVGKKFLSSYSNKDISSAVMHEFMHAAMGENIDNYLNGSLKEGTVKESIVRVNKFKNNIIKNFDKTQEYQFEIVIVKYLNSVTDNKLRQIIGDTTVHSRVQSWAQSILGLRMDPTIDLDGTIQEMLDRSEVADQLPEGLKISYYSLLNLKEFSAVSSTDKETRKFLEKISDNKYIESIKEFFNSLLESLGINSEVSKKLLTDILNIAEVKQESVKVVSSSTSLLESNRENKSLFTYSDGNTYFIEGNNIYSINNPDKATKHSGNSKRALINSYIKEVSKTIKYSPNDLEITALNTFVLDGTTYDSLYEYGLDNTITDEVIFENYKQNPKLVAKFFKYVESLESASTFNKDLYVRLKKEFDFKETTETTESTVINTEHNKFNLPQKLDTPIKVANKYNEIVKYANKMIGDNKEVQRVYSDVTKSIFDSMSVLGEQVKKNCKGSSTKKAADGLRGTLTVGNKWILKKDLKGLPSHAQGGVNVRIDNGKVMFSNKQGNIEAKYGLYISKEPTKPKKTRKQEMVSGTGWKQVYNYRNSSKYSEQGSVIPTDLNRKKASIKSNNWKVLENENSKFYASNGVYLPRKKENTDFKRGDIWSIKKDLEGFPSHNQGGIDIFVDDNNNINFTRGSSKIQARCGLVIKKSK